MGSRTKETDFIKDVLDYLGCVSKTVKHGHLYSHPERKFTIQIAGSTSDHRSIKNLQADVSRTVKDNFTFEEITDCLEPLMKKRKLKVLPDGRVKIGAFYKTLSLEDKFLFKLMEPPRKRITTDITPENHQKLKDYAELNEKTFGEVIDSLISMKSDWFDNIPNKSKRIDKVEEEVIKSLLAKNKKLKKKSK